MPVSRVGTASRSRSTPRSPLAPISTAQQVTPTAPMSGGVGDDERDAIARQGVLRRGETRRIEAGKGARAHRKDVAQTGARPGGGALMGFDGARMVMAPHLGHDRLAVTDIDDAGVL